MATRKKTSRKTARKKAATRKETRKSSPQETAKPSSSWQLPRVLPDAAPAAAPTLVDTRAAYPESGTAAGETSPALGTAAVEPSARESAPVGAERLAASPSVPVLDAGASRLPAPKRPATSASEGAAEAPGGVVGSAASRVGVVSHYFGRVHAAVVAIETGELRVGDMVHVRGHTTDYYQRIDRIEIDHQAREVARSGDSAGIHVAQRVRPHDVVYRLSR